MTTEKESRRRELLCKAEGVADRLERTLGHVQRAVEDFKTYEKRFEYSADLASRIQHDVLWGLANLGLDHLTTAAAEYAKATDEELEDEVYDLS